MSDKMLDKLAKILKQAENAGTPEEAEAFMKKAQALATTNAIDLAVARQHTAKREQREQPTHRVINIGEKRKQGNAFFIDLFRYVASNNDVKINIFHDNTGVIAFGMPSDIEVVEVLYASLLFQMVEAANAWLKTGAYKQERVWRTVTKKDSWGYKWKEEEYAPMTAQQARKNFYEGFNNRVFYRLSEARREALEAVKDNVYSLPTAADPEGPQVEVSAALVLKEKKDEIREYYESKSTAKGSWKGSSVGNYSRAAHSAGDSAGRSARLGSAKAIGGQRTSIAA